LKDQNFNAVSLDGSLGKRSGITDLAKTLSFLASLGHAVDLNAWEEPERETRKQRMSVPLSGVNYRNKGSGTRNQGSEAGGRRPEVGGQETEIENRKSEVGKRELENKRPAIKSEKKKQNTPSELPVSRPKNPGVCAQNINNDINTMKAKSSHNNVMVDALHVLQDGLKAMQALQKQTAETHQKFLETQTQATKTLQNMMENTQRLVEGALGIHSDPNTSRIPVEPTNETVLDTRKISAGVPDRADDPKISDVQTHIENLADNFKDSGDVGSRPIETVNKGENAKPAAKDPAPPENDQEHIKSKLLNTVSRLTGYPVEMLALDMDIEADLGIDSIKRVEILSVLEEKMPGLPTVSPEVMGSLKTLGQIAEYLSDTSDGDAPSTSESKDVEPSTTRHQDVEHRLVETVSRLTGYPVEMLALDMDIEADLGIDSIKRVEILSVLEEKMPGLPTVSPEVMGSLKTLGQIVEYLAGTPKTEISDSDTSSPSSASHPEPAKEHPESSLPEASDFSAEYLAANIGRRVVSAVEKPLVQNRRLSFPEGRTVYVTNDYTGLSLAIVDQFKSRDIPAEILSEDRFPHGTDIESFSNNIGGLIIVAEHAPKDHRFLKDAFSLAKHLGPHLLDSAEKGGALFAAITRLDGAFGFKGLGIDHPIQGGLAGLIKTAAIEWEKVCCRAIDIAADRQDHADIAETVVSELLFSDPLGPVEVGFDSNSRWILQLESRPYPQGDIRLNPKDVVVVSGGARGVTAAAACALAKHAKPTLVLLGRSPHPIPEPEWLLGIEDPAGVKKAILDNELISDPVTPVQLEKIYKKYMANREIARNIETIKNLGADVHYFSVDVRDGDAVNTILNDVRNAIGPIKGIVHGAGMLADCRIVDKSVEQFETVFNTKVKGLNVLLDAAKPDPLDYLVLFSSVTARMGNNGQADYAMANEVLNKIAQKESVHRPACRVVSINWGPWDGGMVCSALKRKFKTSGVDLIPVDAGAMCMIHEMKGCGGLPVEVIIGANILPQKHQDNGETVETAHVSPTSYQKKENLFLTVQRDIDVDRFPILGAHILDGKPVVPFALIAEWLGHGALHENPGLLLHGLDDMRIFHGIKLDETSKHIRLMAGKARKKGSAFEVEVEIRDGFKDNIEVIHSGATAILTDRLDPPPGFDLSAFIGTNGYSKTIDEIYENVLFHGVELQGIQEIIGYSSQFITARITSAPSPASWMKDPLRSQWIADPLVLDSACQMAILWCFEERGMVSLPSYSASYRQYRDSFPSDGVTAILEIKDATDHKIKGDFTFLDSDSVVVARMTGYEAVMDKSLSRAFKPEHLS
ncbi:MAG: SDR family NAD(P)-dependent oxidoreductase, partial [Desulfobacterales bacterium]